MMSTPICSSPGSLSLLRAMAARSRQSHAGKLRISTQRVLVSPVRECVVDLETSPGCGKGLDGFAWAVRSHIGISPTLRIAMDHDAPSRDVNNPIIDDSRSRVETSFSLFIK